ncbi:MAG: lipopolysaccharide transport periplasmic protein LptA [Gammaproteobacteria bacterium]|nr:MAG: lipopolysaccharide transport periplasmic protein LptA [Gammaproteobacteria bacterium]
MKTLPALLTLVTLTVPATALALKSDKDQPADIQSRTVDADERTEVALYRDRVRYVQGTRRIDADRMDVAMKDGEVEQAKAWGEPVRVRLRPDNSQHDTHAAGLRMEYRRANDQFELFDAVTLNHLPDDPDKQEMRASGDRMLYRAAEDVAELFGRVIVQQGGDVTSGGYAHVDLKTDRLTMRGGAHTGERVYSVIQPRKKKDGTR